MPGILPLQTLATLDISAASGAVLHNDVLLVIADDGLALHRYTLRGKALDPLPLFPGREPLPAEHNERKKWKPDLEALAQLPDGSLLAMGSGSAANRRAARRVSVHDGNVVPIDLTPLYTALAARVADLNIEGAVVRGDRLVLAHRGTRRGGSALILLDLAQTLADLAKGHIGADAVRRVQPLVLGALDGVALTPTDLALGPDGTLWYIASAENTTNPYDDGSCLGSVIGCLDDTLRVDRQWRLSPTVKVEGLHFQQRDAGGERWLLVTDADSATIAARLFSVQIPADQPMPALAGSKPARPRRAAD